MKLVYVKWVDAMAADIGWKTIEDAIEWEKIFIVQLMK